MKSKSLFTENELSILKTLWGAKEPLSRLRILERMAAQELNPTSFHFATNSLIDKGYVEVAGFEQCGTNYGRTYVAVKTREDFIMELLSSTRPVGQERECAAELMMAFVKRGGISEETIAELEAMLAERRKELEQKKEGEEAALKKE